MILNPKQFFQRIIDSFRGMSGVGCRTDCGDGRGKYNTIDNNSANLVKQIDHQMEFAMAVNDTEVEFGHHKFQHLIETAYHVAHDIPMTHDEAMRSPDSEKWREAESLELQTLHSKNTFVKRVVGKHVKCIGCKWVYAKKFNADGDCIRWKARLVAKDFTQQYGIDYDQTFAPVVKHTTLRILLAIAQHHGWPVEGGDAVNAYVQATVKEYLLMNFPPGYPGDQDEKLQLLKSIYGLKRASYCQGIFIDEFPTWISWRSRREAPIVGVNLWTLTKRIQLE